MLLGAGVGASSVAVPVYVAETAPAALRGALGSVTQLAVTVGILLAYVAGALAPHCESVAALLGTESADVRRRAVELMGHMPGEEIAAQAPAILPLLTEEDEDVRLSTVELLGRLPSCTLAREPYHDALLRRVQAALDEAPTAPTREAALILLRDAAADVLQGDDDDAR